MWPIKFVNFTKSFGDTLVFDNFCCDFAGGAISIIMAPSGAGKTTLLNAVAGLIDYEGSIEIGDNGLDGAEGGGGVSYVFQEPRLIPQKTVLKNLDFALSAAIPDKAERRDKITALLGEIGLGGALNLYPVELSGGMAQRAALARAFLYPSAILLMDEPFKGLDADTKKTVTDTFLSLWQRDRRTTLFVTHDTDDAEAVGGTVYKLGDKPISGYEL